MKFADIHAHIFPEKIAAKAAQSIGEFYGTQPGHLASADNLAQKEQAAGVCRVAVSNSAVTETQVRSVNTFIAEACAAHTEFLGFGSLLPTMSGYCEELDYMQAYGLRGVKIHPDFQRIPLDLPTAIPLYREIARRGLPVLVHMGDDRYDYSAPERLRNLTQKVPDLIVIAAHLGGYRAWRKSYEMPQRSGVYYDTSSSLMFLSPEEVHRMIDRFGIDRILFGSDFPMWTPQTEVQRLLEMDLRLTPAELERVFYGNFIRMMDCEA